jgi:predicted transcriptional regulator
MLFAVICGLRALARWCILSAHIALGGNMTKVNVTCRLDSEAVAFLDTLGKNVDRDRSYLIKDAVSRYIEMHRWQIDEIEKGIAEADAGKFASEEQVERAFERWTREN